MGKGKDLEESENLLGNEASEQEGFVAPEEMSANMFGSTGDSAPCAPDAEPENPLARDSASKSARKWKFSLKAWSIYLLKWIVIYLGITLTLSLVGSFVCAAISDQTLEGNFFHALVVVLRAYVLAFIPFFLLLVLARILRERKGPGKRKRKTAVGASILAGLPVLLILAMLVAPAHQWREATCSDPRTCTVCGIVEGEALGHEWMDASCTEPKNCSRCGKTEGTALGHDMQQPTCTEGSACRRCGQEFPAAGHKWKDATCTIPKNCTVCGIAEGEALGHTTTNGTCSRCGEKIFETVRGNGDDVVENIQLATGMYRAHVTNSGSRNFVLRTDGNSSGKELKINEIGSYDGYIFLLGGDTYKFEIESSGSWSYAIEEVPMALQTKFSGKGDYVTGKISCSSGTWHFTHDGKGNFVVRAYTTDGRDLSVNTIGAYDGKKSIDVPSGSDLLLEIKADGNWVAEKQ